jgi:adhesin transport system outer membrane protein
VAKEFEMFKWLFGIELCAFGIACLSLSMPSVAQSLPILIGSALSTHPSVRFQRAQGEAARQAVEGAQWQLYPTPSVGFERVNANPGDANYPSYGDKNVMTLRLQQPLWTGGRLTAGLDKAQSGVSASQATMESVRQDLALRVVQIYADWYGALLKRQAWDKSLQAHQTLRAQILRRIGNGVSPQSDLTLLVGRQQQTEADQSAARAQVQTALGRLSQMLGCTLLPEALVQSVSAAQALDDNPQDLMDQAQMLNPGVLRLQAQARIAEAEIRERRADLLPELYVRAERQYGNYGAPDSAPINRYFVGFSSRLGAGLSSLSQVGGAQARLDAALADIEITRVSLGEQIQADFAQAQAGQARLVALQASLVSSDSIARAWSRQFVAGRKTWLDVMNAVREQALLEVQIADARASQLLLSWRLSIVGRGLDRALELGQNSTATPAPPATSTPDSGVREPSTAGDFGDKSWRAIGQASLYEQDPSLALALRPADQIDSLHFGLGLLTGGQREASTQAETGVVDSASAKHNNLPKEQTW